jgi:predicted GNAT family acetyltransferase
MRHVRERSSAGRRRLDRMSVTIVDNPERNRYEAIIEGEVAGFSEYEKRQDFVVFPHTEVNKSYRGMGIADRLVQRAVDEVHGVRGKIYPLCPFVKSWLDKHPEYEYLRYEPKPGDTD